MCTGTSFHNSPTTRDELQQRRFNVFIGMPSWHIASILDRRANSPLAFRLGDTLITNPDPSHMSEAEYADWLYEHRDELEVGEPVDVEVSPNLTSVVSVRFKQDELQQIEKAAQAAGMPFTTYIREAALATSGITNINRIRRDAKDYINSLMTCSPRWAKKPLIS